MPLPEKLRNLLEANHAAGGVAGARGGGAARLVGAGQVGQTIGLCGLSSRVKARRSTDDKRRSSVLLT